MRRPNTATIHSLAGKLRAREWARALGRPRRDRRCDFFEQEAQAAFERMLERTKEEQRHARHRRILSECLERIGRGGTSAREPLIDALRTGLGAVAHVAEIKGDEKGWRVVLETPGAPKRRWRPRGPWFRLELDSNLKIVAYEPARG